jgi:cyclase
MKKKRLIPVLLLKNGFLVQSKSFQRHQNLGNPVIAVKRLSEWAADELIYLDISRDDVYDLKRDDLGTPNRSAIMDIIADVSQVAHMPITVGGKIRTLEDIRSRLSHGADKVCINTKPLEDPEFITEAAREFGSQCIVISMDVKKTEDGYKVFSNGGRNPTPLNPVAWAKRVEALGAGEILVNAIDRDGSRTGYDLELIASVADSVQIPVIALGGVGEWEHFGEALDKTNVDAIAAANIWHYTDQSVYLAKKYLYEKGFQVRPPDIEATILA